MQVAVSRNSISAKIFGRVRLLLTLVSAGFTPFARVVDMAPTLAAIVRVTRLEKLDGHVLQNATR